MTFSYEEEPKNRNINSGFFEHVIEKNYSELLEEKSKIKPHMQGTEFDYEKYQSKIYPTTTDIETFFGDDVYKHDLNNKQVVESVIDIQGPDPAYPNPNPNPNLPINEPVIEDVIDIGEYAVPLDEPVIDDGIGEYVVPLDEPVIYDGIGEYVVPIDGPPIPAIPAIPAIPVIEDKTAIDVMHEFTNKKSVDNDIFQGHAKFFGGDEKPKKKSIFIQPSVKQPKENTQKNTATITEERQKRNLIFKLQILNEKYPNQKIAVDLTNTLDEIQAYHKYRLSYIKGQIGCTNYKKYLVVIFLVIEFVLKKYTSIDMTGFTQNQMDSIETYDEILIELGEKYSMSDDKDSSIGVEIRFMILVVFNTAIFIFSKTVLSDPLSIFKMFSKADPKKSHKVQQGDENENEKKKKLKLRGPPKFN